MSADTARSLMPLNNAIMAADIVLVLVTLAQFTRIHYAKYSTATLEWNRINRLAIGILPITLLSILPQFFLFGRTDRECYLLHHSAGSLYYTTNGLVKVFFLMRSNLMADSNTLAGRLLMAACGLNIISAVVVGNFVNGTAVIDDICVVLFDPIYAILYIFILPIALDLAINIRFLYFLHISIKVTSAAASDTTVPRRLLKTTCLLSVSAMMVTLTVILCVMGIIPLADPSLLTPIIVSELTYNVCAMAWPTIINHCFGGRNPVRRETVIFPKHVRIVSRTHRGTHIIQVMDTKPAKTRPS